MELLIGFIDVLSFDIAQTQTMKYSLRQLEIFLTIARYQNISKAAERLHMSQSAASAALQNLEQAYSISLFNRVGKKQTDTVGLCLIAWAKNSNSMKWGKLYVARLSYSPTMRWNLSRHCRVTAI